jgi:hypothetical protein
MQRLRRYVPSEKEALERWEESCRIRGDEALQQAASV